MQKTTKQTLTKLSLALVATAFAAGANAATYLWDFQNNPSSTSATFTDASVSGTGLTAGFNVTLSAYYSTGTNLILNNGAGMGFTNQGSSGIGMTSPLEPTGAPQHAVDNITPNQEFVVIDAGSGNSINWSGIRIAYGIDDYNTSTGGSSSTSRADVKLWAVNTLPGTVAGLGTGTTLGNLAINTTANLDGSCTGAACTGSGGANIAASRYLVIAGDVNDAFKLQQIGGTTGSPPNQTPEPGSIALIGLGLLGFGFARKRRKAA